MNSRLCFSSALAGRKSSGVTAVGVLIRFSLMSISSLSQLDARIRNRIADIHDNVHEDDQSGQEDGRAHDHHVILIQDGADELAAQARDREDLLHDEGAGQCIGNQRSDVGDDRQDRVAQRMLVKNLGFRKALGLGRAHVVLAQHIQHGRTHLAGDVRSRIEGQRHDRHDVVLPAGQAVRRQPAQFNAEEIHEDRADDEARHGDAHGREHDDDVVSGLAAVQRRNASQRDAQAQRQDDGDAADARGNRELGGDDLRDGAAALFQRQAEVAVQGVLHVVPVLYDDRFVQAVLLTHGLHCRCADGFLSDERSARHLLHEHEGQRRHDEQRQHPEQHSLENILSQN